MNTESFQNGRGFRMLRTLLRLTIRLRPGVDDDLIETVDKISLGRRAPLIRQAIREAYQAGYRSSPDWWDATESAATDRRITVRFMAGEDEVIVAYLQSLPARRRSAFVRGAMRVAIEVFLPEERGE